MLVLSRKKNERILVGDDIAITVVHVGKGAVRIGIEAPQGVNVVREELLEIAQDQPQGAGDGE